MAKSPILGGFSKSRAGDLSSGEVYNLFMEVVETKDGKSPGTLYNSAGLDLNASLGSGPIRGVHVLNDILYVVSGPQVWSLTPNGIATLCGTIGIETSPVSMFDNRRQLLILDGVGGWLVPGGYPLASGTISAPGGLYALGDTITLKATSGNQSSYPVLEVTAVSDNPVTAYTLPNAGTAYGTAASVATTTINGQPGHGTGLTLSITASAGSITVAEPLVAGSGYAVGDTGTITGGSGNAVYRVTAIGSGGAVTTVIMLNPGTLYASIAGCPTTAAPGVPANVGTGLALNITASSGSITASGLANGGRNYAVGNVGFVSGGSGDATYLVTAIGANGTVTGFSITQAGAADPVPASFTQKSTSGSGSNFTLTSPTFGTFVGLVPVSLPFAQPLMGGVIDGFGLMIFLGSQNIAGSDELDLSTWRAVIYGVANQSPDSCMALAVVKDEAFILKERNTEVWVDQGLPGFAFGPISAVHIEHGCAAPFSATKIGDHLAWLSRNDQGQGIVVLAQGYNVTPISTQALVAEFESYPNIGDAIGYSRQQGGHTFYVLTFPEADKTWCFDLTASSMAGVPLWHRLAAWTAGKWHRHWGNCFTPWRGSEKLVTAVSTYQAKAVTLTGSVATASGLVGLPSAFFCGVFSVWLDVPDSGGGVGVTFSNQAGGTAGGLSIAIQNDANGTPQITVKAWDASAAAIVVATYDFTGWTVWVNVLVSIDTATQQLQVYANTVVSGVLVETALTAVSAVWSSSNAIAPAATRAWSLSVVP